MSRKGSVTVTKPVIPDGAVTLARLRSWLAGIVAQVGLEAIGDEEMSDVSFAKLIAGTLSGDKVLQMSGAGVVLKSTNFQKDLRRFVIPLVSNLSKVISAVPGTAEFTAADIGRTIVGEGLNNIIASINSADQAVLTDFPGAPAVNVVAYMAARPAGAGWALYGDGKLEVNAGGIFRGTLELAGFAVDAFGAVSIGVGDSKMKANPDGSFTWGSGGAVVGITPAGELFAGGVDYASSIFRVAANGDTTIRNTAQSVHSISIGAILNDILEPRATPGGGNFDTTVNVYLLDQTQGVKIYYTTDGTTPDATKTLYTGAPIVLVATTTVKAIAIKLGESSTVMSTTFTLGAAVVANPVADPVGGDYSPAGGTLNVILTCSLAGASIRYTTDGSTPSDVAGTVIASGGSVPLGTGVRTLKAIAYKAGKTNSGVITEVYTITYGGSGTGGGGTGGGRGNVP